MTKAVGSPQATQSMHKSNYHVDLAALMRTYETNYAKLNALISHRLEVGDIKEYQVQNRFYRIKILEITRYTSLVEVTEVPQDKPLQYPLPSMTVRLYHDAKVAEVCASQQISNIKATYNYPNPKMMQQDEKHQINQFLGDWLSFCLRYGITKSWIY